MCGPVDLADDLRVDAEVPERLDQRARDLLLPGGVGLGRLAGGALEEARRSGTCQTKSRVVGDRGAVAALRREVVRVDGRGTPCGAVGSSGSARAKSSASSSSTSSTLSCSSVIGGPPRGWRARSSSVAPGLGRQHVVELGVRRQHAVRARRRRRSPGVVTRSRQLFGRAAQRAAGLRHADAGRADDAGDRHAGDQEQSGEQAGRRRGCARRASRRGARTTQNSDSPITPPRRSKAAACQKPGPLRRPGRARASRRRASA